MSRLCFIKSQKGATAIEYCLIAAGIAGAIIIVVFSFGEDLAALFGRISGIIP